ncbi:MAG: hypothetical protein RL490_2190 [Pseudomonadota bacterium]
MRIALLAAVFVSAPALAQSANEVAAQAALNELIPPPGSKAVAGLALAELQKDARAKSECVPTTVTLAPIKPASATRLAIDGMKRRLMRNAWSVVAMPQGCPSPLPVRIAVVLLGNDELVVLPYATGDSIAWVSLVGDAKQNIASVTFAALAARNPDWKCSQTDPVVLEKLTMAGNATGLGPDFYGVRYTGSWQEIWTFSMCRRKIDVPVTFTADGNGGAYWKATAAPGAK